MKRILLWSALTSLTVSIGGFLINLFSYHTAGKLVFYRELAGGEWVGYSGFGILMNRTFPLTYAGDPDAGGRTWLTFEPVKLLLTAAGVFLAVFALLLLIRLLTLLIRKKKAERK